jgi:hypothetical protein
LEILLESIEAKEKDGRKLQNPQKVANILYSALIHTQ